MHPYTIGLIRSVPMIEARKSERLRSIPGFPPDMTNLPKGCAFCPRCEFAQERCYNEVPELVEIAPGRKIACHYPQINYHTSDDTQL